jgi:hypothetical protein
VLPLRICGSGRSRWEVHGEGRRLGLPLLLLRIAHAPLLRILCQRFKLTRSAAPLSDQLSRRAWKGVHDARNQGYLPLHHAGLYPCPVVRPLPLSFSGSGISRSRDRPFANRLSLDLRIAGRAVPMTPSSLSRTSLPRSRRSRRSTTTSRSTSRAASSSRPTTPVTSSAPPCS